MSTARDSFRHRSSVRASSVATGDGLPISKPGEAMGESSTLKNSSPSVGLCSRGRSTSHDTLASTLSRNHSMLKEDMNRGLQNTEHSRQCRLTWSSPASPPRCLAGRRALSAVSGSHRPHGRPTAAEQKVSYSTTMDAILSIVQQQEGSSVRAELSRRLTLPSLIASSTKFLSQRLTRGSLLLFMALSPEEPLACKVGGRL